ncbi:holin [Romboutsia weinsteinii]|uniref:Holin n=1 Tax=Romboutsia weinsteinii TaxID=2020949 RepID=A0A371J5N0_9FIRM|nr:phage holin family protein [Romboutsia weinsteinii]RDY28014.1 holin [Romboutsia weinsteinii]
MDLGFLQQFCVPVVIGICLCVGYVIKTSLDFIPNKYIPLIMLILGLGVNLLIHQSINANIVLAGMFSGLASTGLHQMFKNLIDKGGK